MRDCTLIVVFRGTFGIMHPAASMCCQKTGNYLIISRRLLSLCRQITERVRERLLLQSGKRDQRTRIISLIFLETLDVTRQGSV